MAFEFRKSMHHLCLALQLIIWKRKWIVPVFTVLVVRHVQCHVKVIIEIKCKIERKFK